MGIVFARPRAFRRRRVIDITHIFEAAPRRAITRRFSLSGAILPRRRSRHAGKTEPIYARLYGRWRRRWDRRTRTAGRYHGRIVAAHFRPPLAALTTPAMQRRAAAAVTIVAVAHFFAGHTHRRMPFIHTSRFAITRDIIILSMNSAALTTIARPLRSRQSESSALSRFSAMPTFQDISRRVRHATARLPTHSH